MRTTRRNSGSEGPRVFVGFLNSAIDASHFRKQVEKIQDAARIPKSQFDQIVLSGFSDLIDNALDDHLLTDTEEARIIELRDSFGLSADSFHTAGCQERLVKGAILRDVKNGSPHSRLTISGNLPFLLQRSEELIWLFRDVKYHELKDRVEYVGRSSGISVRIARGVYLRTGAFKGQRMSSQSLDLVDNGFFGITNKHVYFKGISKGFRIALNKLISVEQFSDGIGIMRDGANPKPQIFAVDDPWFAANLLANRSS